MMIKPIVMGTVAYTVCTFLLAVLWHVVIFGEMYEALGYFSTEPNFLLGLGTIFIQGIVLSFLFPRVNIQGSSMIRGLKFSLGIGFFFWTSHVLAFIAKQAVSNVFLFVSMESFYLFLQFGIYGLAIGFIFSKTIEGEQAAA